MERLKYLTKVADIDNTAKYGKDAWKYIGVKIFETLDDGSEKEIGSYERNYPNFLYTFLPFKKDGKEYALYSPNYAATRVMELPSCKDIAGEEPNRYAFCPVEYFVPQVENPQFGFVSGCEWGDDTSWKVQFLDLSRIEDGILKRDERFGYIQHPKTLK